MVLNGIVKFVWNIDYDFTIKDSITGGHDVTGHSWVVFEKLGVVWNSSAWCGIF